MATTTRVYTPLPGTSSVRLLFIEAGGFTDMIHVRLQVFPDLVACPPFNALSYTWGDPDPSEIISCNGVDIRIRKNLADALRRFRAPVNGYRAPRKLQTGWLSDIKDRLQWKVSGSGRPAWADFAQEDEQESFGHSQVALWADALCINQDDLAEKSVQVRLMRRIYQQADSVLIWLGANGKGVDDALWLIARTLRNTRRELGNWRKCDLDDLDQQLLGDWALNDIGFPSRYGSYSYLWKGLCSFYNRPWFCRVWIYQEVILARKCEVFAGSYRIEWLAITQAARWSIKWGLIHLPGILYDCSEGLSNAATLGRHTRLGKIKPLGFLLSHTAFFQASNPLDKVFALLGLAEEYQETLETLPSALETDYRREHTQLYRDVTRYLIERDQSLCILSFNQADANSQDSTLSKGPRKIPSWVQLFNSPRTHRSLGSYGSMYQASSNIPVEIGSSKTEDVLVLAGLTCGVVRSYTAVLSKAESPTASVKRVFDFYNSTSVKDHLSAFALTFTNEHHGTTLPEPQKLAMATFLAVAHDIHFMWLDDPRRVKKYTPDFGRLTDSIAARMAKRRLFITENGYTGLGPANLRQGDMVVVLFGGKVPYILRQQEGHHVLVGETYTLGLSSGEAIELMKRGQLEKRRFEIR
ncbi:hypothetical protein FNYG_14603 [Fusarium nygamai]|uniref:Heterokaryon incompatibility domain-containing protein n=1 Tax=Gibberella nygamai TaxID=42673 RepID=A0A2K0USC5_GIBNY|nr:hypothetical protein FNYG_14603 [Fusarium nygamai]